MPFGEVRHYEHSSGVIYTAHEAGNDVKDALALELNFYRAMNAQNAVVMPSLRMSGQRMPEHER